MLSPGKKKSEVAVKRLALVGLKTCERCHQAVAYLMTEDGEHTVGIALDTGNARELSRNDQEPEEKFLTDLLLRLLASSSHVPQQVVFDCSQGGFLSAKVVITTETFSCSPQEGLVFAAVAQIPLYAVERIFEQRHLFHALDTTGESSDLLRHKLKPTLH